MSDLRHPDNPVPFSKKGKPTYEQLEQKVTALEAKVNRYLDTPKEIIGAENNFRAAVERGMFKGPYG